MGKTKITQYSFTAGEIAPSLAARTDVGKYSIALAALKNGFVHVTGGVSNRAGLEFVCEVKDSSKATRVVPFTFNTEQTYVIEAGEKYFRYIQNGGQIVNNNSIVETGTPFTSAQLFSLKYAQTADVLTLCNQEHTPQELSRNSNTNWTIEDVVIEPSIATPVNISAIKTGSSSSSTKTYRYKITAIKDNTYEESIPSAVSNDVIASVEAGWLVGEKIILSWGAVAGAVEYNIYKEINGVFAYAGVTSNTSFEDNNIDPDLTTCVPIYKNPFVGEGNFPACVNYFQQRIMFANTKNKPNFLYSSQTALFNNFNTQRPLIATNAVTTKLYDGKMNAIKDLVSTDDLVVLAADAEWRVNGADGIFQATPVPVAKKQSSWGSSDLMPIYSGDMILFVSSGKNKIRDLEYNYAFDKYKGNDLTYLANHLFKRKRIIDWAYSKEPDSIIWCVMSDGTLNGLTYNPEQQILGWHHHETDGKFESVTVVREGYEDIPYFVIKRNINGTVKRYIERMKSRIIDNAKDGFFVDCGLAYNAYENTTDNLLTLSALTGSITLTAASSIFTASMVGNTVNTIDESGVIVGQAKITTFTNATHVTATVEKDFESLTFEGKYWGVQVDALGGLNHLEGKEVIILADGGVIEGKTVSSGSVSLGSNAGINREAAKITVGLPYEFELKTLNFEGDGTQGARKILNAVNIKVDNSREDFTVLGIDGVAVDLDERSMESINDAGHLTSGDLMCYPRAEAKTGVYVHIKQPLPLPITILSLTPTVELTE